MSTAAEDLETHEPDEVVDEAAVDQAPPNPRYDITSFGSDPDVEGLVRRLDRGEILIPEFQRGYVWPITQASRFIESLLLGLPVPGVFFAVEPETNKHLVLDGQQRLKTVQFFRGGFFNPRPGDIHQRVFSLEGVHPRFEGKTFATLGEPDRLRLDHSVIHATIVKQDSPAGDDTSLYHIFSRLNSSGLKLTAQEIRCALYHGPLMQLLKELNDNPTWRAIYGRQSSRLKDQELILRYLAFTLEPEHYERPMAEFLNKFSARHKGDTQEFYVRAAQAFSRAIQLAWVALEEKAFRPERGINAAVFDSVMVGLTKLLEIVPDPDSKGVRRRYQELLQDKDYQGATSKATADEASVRTRMKKAVAFLTDSLDEEP